MDFIVGVHRHDIVFGRSSQHFNDFEDVVETAVGDEKWPAVHDF